MSWRTETFENEEARDWLDDLVDERDIYFIHYTLEIIADYPKDEKPESWDCGCALAAAEMLAAALGKPSEALPAEAQEWLDAYGLDIDDEIMQMARRALDRIESNSYLREEVEKSGSLPDWQAKITDLRKRLAV